MKTIRIILLTLILLGLASLATQKLWVPVLVNKIMAHENASAAPIQPVPVAIASTQQCYSYTHEATKDEPFAVKEFLDLTIHGTTVTGTKTGTQTGPNMSNGYQGTIKGSVKDASIDAIFSYTVEGASNAEQELYTILADQGGLEKRRYPLKEKGKVLVPDTTQSFTALVYTPMQCAAK